MECPDCGFDNIEGAEYCEDCGADQVGSSLHFSLTQFDLHLMTDLVDVLEPRAPVTVPRSTSCAEAIALLQEKNVGCLLISADGRQIEGVFTEDDVLRRLSRDRRAPREVRVEEVMTADPVVLRHDDTVAVAVNKMVLGRFRHMPVVVAAGNLDGIFSGRDILKHLLKLLQANR